VIPPSRILIVLGLIVVLFLYSIIADRLTPYTSHATVQAFVVRRAPEDSISIFISFISRVFDVMVAAVYAIGVASLLRSVFRAV
jgi:hypothetical protein